MSRYFSIDAILAESEPIPCQMRTNAYRLGYLDPSHDFERSSDLQRKAKLALPFWLGFAMQQRGLVKVELLPAYQERTRKSLQNETAFLSLCQQHPYFYEVGRLLSLTVPASTGFDVVRDIAGTLVKVFAHRFKEIVDHSQFSDSNQMSKFTSKLCLEEQRYYRTIASAMSDFRKWRRRSSHVLEAIDTNISFAPSSKKRRVIS